MADLAQFIQAVKAQGASDDFVVQMLKQRGWPEKEVYQAFAAHYEGLTGTPVPQRVSSAEAAKDAFVYLLSFATLGTWTIALGSLAFVFINLWFPDPIVQPNPYYRSTAYNISTELASLIVAFPLYAWVLRWIGRGIEANPEKARSGVRKWLSYLALFIAAGCVIGDLITFLAYFIRGELTTRFVLKILVVVIIAGGVFWFYLTSLREGDGEATS
jgi:hypothetical protein